MHQSLRMILIAFSFAFDEGLEKTLPIMFVGEGIYDLF